MLDLSYDEQKKLGNDVVETFRKSRVIALVKEMRHTIEMAWLGL